MNGVKRQFPNPRELSYFLRLRVPPRNAVSRRLSRAFTIDDLRTVARRRVPRAVFDYVDGAAESEISAARSRQFLHDLEFVPSILRDVSETSTSTTLLGRASTVPFVFAPTGFTRMMHHEGERAVAGVAERRGIPYVLSTMGTVTIEDFADAIPTAPKWFQLYMSRDRDLTAGLIERAGAAAFDALVLTVDVPVPGARLRDVRNGFGFPPRLGVGTFVDGMRHPAWTVNMMTTAPLAFASMSPSSADIASHMSRLFDPSVTLDDLAWIRSIWPGPIIVKGVQKVEDARRVADAGVEAIVLSNHGGRQLDRAPVPMRLLPAVVDAVGGRLEIGVDSGFRSGADVVAALALGADFVLIGRAYLYGLMAAGARGVDIAAEILTAEIRRTMQLMGVSTVHELSPDHIVLPKEKR